MIAKVEIKLLNDIYYGEIRNTFNIDNDINNFTGSNIFCRSIFLDL